MSYQFHGQRTNEEVLLLSKKHPFVLFHPFLISTLVLLIPVAMASLISVGIILSVTVVVCIVFALIHATLAWFAWRNTTFLLTTERVVFLEQRGLVHREFVESMLANIQQVAHEVKGVRQTLFRYGNIALYTSGSQQPIIIRDMPDPYELQQEILRARAGEGFVEEDEEETATAITE